MVLNWQVTVLLLHWGFKDGVASRETSAVIEFSFRDIYCANSTTTVMGKEGPFVQFFCPDNNNNNTAIRHQFLAVIQHGISLVLVLGCLQIGYRYYTIPHPTCNLSGSKLRCIVAVGRWTDAMAGGETCGILITVMLPIEPGCSNKVFGTEPPSVVEHGRWAQASHGPVEGFI